MLTRLWRWLVGADEREMEKAALSAWEDEIRADEMERWEMIRAMVARMRCPKCARPINGFSFENDYLCDVHGFVNPVMEDGTVVNGDGDYSRDPLRRSH